MFRDPGVPSPAALAHLLRNLPPEWEWDYMNCNRCAMGVARAAWESHNPDTPGVQSTAKLLGIQDHQATRMFTQRTRAEDRTPEAIALDLEALALVDA